MASTCRLDGRLHDQRACKRGCEHEEASGRRSEKKWTDTFLNVVIITASESVCGVVIRTHAKWWPWVFPC